VSRVLFAILAHDNPPCLQDLIENVRIAAPGSDVVLYNGGPDRELARGLDIALCGDSQPLHHDWITPFPWAVMRWAAGEKVEFDYLITLEGDMLLLRPGLPERLSTLMAGSDYMAAHFGSIDSWWHPWSIGRRARWQWQRSGWAELLGTDRPYGAFGPGQVMSRRYVDRLLAHPRLPEIIDRAQRSRLRALVEIIYPTLAVSLGCAPVRNPASRAMLLRRHSAAELLSYAEDPDVHLVHKVGLGLADQDRAFVNHACRTSVADPGLLAGYSGPADGWRHAVRRTPARTARRTRRAYRDLQAALLVERFPSMPSMGGHDGQY
jgi:hypothetical protein